MMTINIEIQQTAIYFSQMLLYFIQNTLLLVCYRSYSNEENWDSKMLIFHQHN